MANDHTIGKLLEQDERLERIEAQMITKQELTVFKSEVLTTLDGMTVILQRLDQERVFTTDTIRRMQQQLDEQQREINRIKQSLKVA